MISGQSMDIEQAEQDALLLMDQGEIARVRMLNLDTCDYEPFQPDPTAPSQ